jgi:hypothetical protein
MPQDNKSSNMDEQNQQAEPAEAGQEEGSVGTKSAEARIWAAATKLSLDGNLQFPEIRE